MPSGDTGVNDMNTESETSMESNETLEEVTDVVAEPGQETDPVSALTSDLQRVQAEYANYKKRVERDRSLAHEQRIGLSKYGTEGDAFDPQIHEALLHDTSAEVTTSTATKILQPGYKFKDRILRPARVGVTDPQETPVSE